MVVLNANFCRGLFYQEKHFKFPLKPNAFDGEILSSFGEESRPKVVCFPGGLRVNTD